MGADKSHPETPKEFLHRELSEFASRCALRGVPGLACKLNLFFAQM
jgi:hypothetical protein